MTIGTGPYDTAYTPTAKKYQYWAVKLKPYLETQFLVTNKIYIDQLLQIDFTFNLESFKSYLWADASVWYQYDSTNPETPASSGIYSNYKNYFFCTDSGLTVKPILMSINLSIKLRNCYKTLIQSLTDWSNWTKIGPNTQYWGILDYCKTSDAESVTVFSWNPVASDYNTLFWGNTDNGNPQVDWDASESGTATAGATQYKFNYCSHLLGTEYDLNNGGLKGDLYCAKSTEAKWTDAATTYTSTKYDRTIDVSACA